MKTTLMIRMPKLSVVCLDIGTFSVDPNVRMIRNCIQEKSVKQINKDAHLTFSGGKPSKLYGPGKGTIWLDSLNCLGNESSIHDCQHDGWGVSDCTHEEDVGVDCEDEYTS